MKVSIFTAAVGDYPEAARYVKNLYWGLREHLHRNFTLYVATDIPEVCRLCATTRAIVGAGFWVVDPKLPVWGWWNLCELYREDAPWSDGHVIMCGLDTVIKGDVSWLIQDKPTYMRPVRESLGLQGAFNGTYADGIVCLPPHQHYNKVWEEFQKIDPIETHQRKRTWAMHPWVTDVIKEQYTEQPQFWQDILPGKLCSYREPERKIEEPEEPLVIFHGNPRPHEALTEAGWLRKYWR